MPVLELNHEQLVPDQTNERLGKLPVSQYMGDLEKLADSIDANGLLQNLVVALKKRATKEHPAYYEIKAGERRWRAIGLLIARGNWPLDKTIPCLCIDTKGWLEQAAENACRQDVPVWRQGHRFIEMIESGVNLKRIACSIGKSDQYVHCATLIARGLCPEVVNKLDMLDPRAVTVSRLIQIARLVDPTTGSPLVAEQLKRLTIAIGQGRRTPRRPTGTLIHPKDSVYQRYLKLRDGRMKAITPQHVKTVEAIIDYLECKTKRLRLPR